MFASACVFSSCDIDMLPLNEVVYENFWTDKSDVESSVTACYGEFKNSAIESLMVWGEMRSDNIKVGQNPSADLQFLLKGSLKSTNGYCSWTKLYKVINYCNVTMFEAPQVMEKDPNYTLSEYRANVAECSFIRDYCYLTLAKTFRDIPFTFEPSLDDTQNFRLPQTKFEDVIDTLIADIEACKDYAPIRYSSVTLQDGADNSQNTGKVTRPAMYALLAELYLWRASDNNLAKSVQNVYYKKCIECCDWILNYKLQRYQAGDIREEVDQEVYKDYGYPLLAEEVSVGRNDVGPEATDAIFGTGASFESLFEVAFRGPFGYEECAPLKSYYDEGRVMCYDKIVESLPTTAAKYEDGKLFPVPSDYRLLTSFYITADGAPANIYKYLLGNRSRLGTGGSYGECGTKFTAADRMSSDEYGNWIIYRLTEVMLFRAEAEMELAFNMKDAEQMLPDPGEEEAEDAENDAEEQPAAGKLRKAAAFETGASLSTPEELLDDAFNLISAVYRRSNPAVKSKAVYAPARADYATTDAFRKLLLNERRREFLFEGKRYFDLVRASRRAGNTQELRKAMANKYSEAGPAVSIKLMQMGFMYMPVLRKEMKINPSLVQNECYLDEVENKK